MSHTDLSAYHRAEPDTETPSQIATRIRLQKDYESRRRLIDDVLAEVNGRAETRRENKEK